MAIKWQVYRMYRQVINIVVVAGSSAERAGQWKATELTFKGRTQAEAQRRAERFWRDAELGAGSLLCILEEPQP